MSASFKPHLEILPAGQRELWPKLTPAAGLGFALYGGTAVALRLGHRASVDFDFFSDSPLDPEAIRRAFGWFAAARVLQESPNTLTLLVPYGDPEHTGVKVSFFGMDGFCRVGEPEVTDDRVAQVASLDDLMATKLKVVLQRAEAKDYRDIAAMLAAGCSLPIGLAAASALFGPSFQPSESLKALVYYGDGDLHLLTPNERQSLITAVSGVRDLPKVSIRSGRLTARV